MSRYEELMACQMPLRFGLPSGARGALYPVVWPGDEAAAASRATAVTAVAMMRFPGRLRIVA